MKNPNILIIMTDQQRWDSLGCYGVDCIETPNLDALAAEGMIFDNCFVNNPLCTPSRASMLTGKYIPEHGVLRLQDILPDEEKLFTYHLKDLGYTTALFGKLHVSGLVHEEKERHPNDGFDIYEWCLEASKGMDSPFNGYSKWLKEKAPEFHQQLKKSGRNLKNIPKEYHFTHWAAEQTIDFIKTHDEQSPFFCFMSIFDPHNPYDDLPIEYKNRVDIKKITLPKTQPHEINHAIRGLKQEQTNGYLGSMQEFTEDDFKNMQIGYYGSIALLDDEVGRVLSAIDEKGIKDNTLVIFLSDHGDMLGDHGLVVKGAYFYDACVKVPLIIRQPGIVKEGSRTKALVQPHDIAATVLTAAGMDRAEIKKNMPDSIDLCNSALVGHEHVICAYRESGLCNTGRYHDPPINATMITDGKFKLNVYHPKSGTDECSSGQLFDLVSDPLEIHNLWDTHSKEKMLLLMKLLDWNMQLRLPRRARSAVPVKNQDST